MIVSIEGEEATGKGVFAYSAPLPIVAVSLDLSWERSIYGAAFPKFFDGLKIESHDYLRGATPPNYGGDITVYQCPQPMQLGGKNIGYQEQWDYILALYARWLQDPATQHGTFVFDTFTLTSRLIRDAYLQELQGKENSTRAQLLQIEYGKPDGKTRTILTNASALKRNIVVVHHLRQEYGPQQIGGQVVNAPLPGKFEHDGVGNIMQLVDVRFRQEKKDGELKSKFVKCGPKLSLEAMPALAGMSWDMMIELISSDWYGPAYDRRAPVKKEETSGI